MIFDGHCDIFTDVLRRRLCGETQVLAHSHLPKLRAGGIRGGCFVLWVDPPFTDDPAARMAQLLSAVAAEMAECSEAALVASAAEIEGVAATERFPILLGVEGLSAIGENVDAIDRLHAFGARHAMLTWNEANALATGAKADPSRGLTELGRRALARLEDLHMLVDVSHLNDRSFWDVLAAVHGPIVASHSNARRWRSIRAISQTISCAPSLRPAGLSGSTPTKISSAPIRRSKPSINLCATLCTLRN